MSRNVVARQRVNMVVKIAGRSTVGNRADKFFELANSHFDVIDNRIYLGPVAGRKNNSSTGVRRKSIKMFFERGFGDGNSFQVFNWREVNI